MRPASATGSIIPSPPRDRPRIDETGSALPSPTVGPDPSQFRHLSNPSADVQTGLMEAEGYDGRRRGMKDQRVAVLTHLRSSCLADLQTGGRLNRCLSAAWSSYLGGPPGAGRPRAGPVESLHCSVAAATLDWSGSHPAPLFVSLYILLGPSGRACRCSALWLSLHRPAELYKSLVNGLCLLVCWHDTWLARGWTAATVSILREGERWLYVPPPPWSRADCHFRARRGGM